MGSFSKILSLKVGGILEAWSDTREEKLWPTDSERRNSKHKSCSEREREHSKKERERGREGERAGEKVRAKALCLYNGRKKRRLLRAQPVACRHKQHSRFRYIFRRHFEGKQKKRWITGYSSHYVLQPLPSLFSLSSSLCIFFKNTSILWHISCLFPLSGSPCTSHEEYKKLSGERHSKRFFLGKTQMLSNKSIQEIDKSRQMSSRNEEINW